jgi:hypothetical protein
MATDGRPNSGALNLFYVLKRRNITFEQWCRSKGIVTKQDYQGVKSVMEQLGEYFFSPEMDELASTLPESEAILVVAAEHLEDPTQATQSALEDHDQLVVDTDTAKEEEATEGAPAAQEKASGRRKSKKAV